MQNVLGRMADLFAILSGLILLTIVAVTTTNTSAFIVDRIARLFGQSVSGLPGYEDFVQLSISCAALMFFPFCQLQRGHVQVDLFVSALPRSVRDFLDRVWLALTAMVALFLAYWMVFGLLEVRSDGLTTSVLSWPVWPFYAPGMLAMVLWALIAISQMFGGAQDA